MASKTNRALQRNHIKAKKQRALLGAIEGMKPAYHSDKPALRIIAAKCQWMVKPIITEKEVYNPTMVLYNPAIHRALMPLALRCAVACDGELVKRADYLRR